MLSALLVAGALHAESWAAATYRITDLGIAEPSGSSTATNINNLGQVAGYSWTPSNAAQATLWSQGQLTVLGVNGQWSYAYGINDTGIVVGTALIGDQLPAQWTSAGEATLPTPGCCSTLGTANAISNQGTVVGWTDDGAVVWRNGSPQTLANPLTRYASIDATAINNPGQIVGVGVGGSVSAPVTRAILWNEDQAIDLGAATGFSASFARSINDSGAVVGASFHDVYNMGEATLWQNGQIHGLGVMAGQSGSLAADINAHGVIVGSGFSGTADNFELAQEHALIWDVGAAMPALLDDLIDEADPLKSVTTLLRASAINDSGVIVGHALINGHTRAYMLTPMASVPEPATWLQTSVGLLAMAGMVGARIRRRQHAAA